MAQIMISEALYQRLQAMAQQRGVPVEALIQDALAGLGSPSVPLSPHEEEQLFDQLDRIACQNGEITSEDWGNIVRDLRD